MGTSQRSPSTKSTNRNPRSTVGTVTKEIYDYSHQHLLYANRYPHYEVTQGRSGETDRGPTRSDQICRADEKSNTAPMVRGKGRHEKVLEQAEAAAVISA